MGEKEDMLRTLLFDDTDNFEPTCHDREINLVCDVPIHLNRANITKCTDRENHIVSQQNKNAIGSSFNSKQPCTQQLNHGFNMPGQVLNSFNATSVFHKPITSLSAVMDSNHYRPLSPASTPSNDLFSRNTTNALSSHNTATKQTFQADVNLNPAFLKHCPASYPQALNGMFSRNMHASPNLSEPFIQKSSEVSAFDSSHSVSGYNPVVLSPLAPNVTSNLGSVHVLPSVPSHYNSSATNGLQAGATVNMMSICDISKKSESLLKSCFTGQIHKSEQYDISGGQKLALSGTPSQPLPTGSFPNHSHLTEDSSHIALNKSITQSYASLVPWTSKLTAPGYEPLPMPAFDAMPITLENSEKGSALSLSPTTQSTTSRNLRSLPLYSRLRTGVACDETNILTKLKNGAVRSSSQFQRLNCKTLLNKEHRFKKTADALQKSGLWEVAMKTGNLIKRNQELQRELELFRADALAFLKSVIKNPQNRDFLKQVLNNALSTNSNSRGSPSVMSVVVSAAAAAAASGRLDSCGSLNRCVPETMNIVDNHMNSAINNHLSDCNTVVAMDMK
ncbi:hypothetical protein Bpfe_030667 [Biomphalaria pfeifferi]|uniref:Uncharacterized protein n=1 Tax=Biomphalaria pfeifferi TaxID=112525 RepID=A0AAD8EV42_BIOPF|nr:hypothetical protein Bpfe_030667 [Biomphalaria pfeifferi]